MNENKWLQEQEFFDHTVFLVQFGINLHERVLKLHFQLFEKLTGAN